MSQTAITLVFEQWKAQQAATGETVLLDEFVFANVPGLDPDLPIDRSETLPPDSQIVHRQAVSRKGVVNENAVVHSVVLGADVGDFSFNWVGLVNKASGTLAMIVHAPVQQKLKTKDGQQGNVLTRSFLMEFTGAQTETAINTPAETWQIDFTARMAGMDERQRLENIDIYGAGAFFGDGYLVGKTGNQYFVTQGVGYVAGLRAQLAANQNITVTNRPVKVWLDVCWAGTLTSAWSVQSQVTVTDSLTDYEMNGVKHYVFALASIDENGVITDLRPKGSLDNQQGSKDFLRKDKNLKDVNDKAEARDNLELKAAAIRDVADNVPGALIPVGYKGNFKSECNHGAIDFATYPFVVGESLFVDSRGCTNTPPFLTQDFYYINVVCATSPAQGGRVNRPLIQFVSYTNSTMIFAIREDDGSTIGWRYFRAVQFDTDNQNITLPGDVRARNGAIELSQSAIIIRGSGNKHLWFFNASGAEMGLVYASDDKVLHLRAGEGPSVNIQSNGNVVTPNYLEAKDDIHSGRNISSVGLIQAGQGLYDTPGVRTYSPNNEPPYPVTSVNGMQGAVSIDLSPYATQNWTRQYFVGDVALGAEGSFKIVKDGWQRVPVGCTQTGYNFEGDNPGGDTIFYRPIQKYMLNIGWVTVGHTA
ncbi:phage tail protein [Enterobacter bugandensis]|uniref:phage tail protein n=1 Tax=Enterobacter bugandensis TaxID=881260 RepID=UPI002FD3BEA3